MILYKKIVTVNRIEELPPGLRERVDEIWEKINRIDLCWTLCPFYVVIAIVFALALLFTFAGVVLPTFGLATWITGILWAFIIYIAVFPLTRVVLFKCFEGSLEEMRKEFATPEGNSIRDFLALSDPEAVKVTERILNREWSNWLL
jgi:hypothetical protein